LYSTIHETGHALYEQGTDPDRMLTPAGSYASIGVHESQSRLWENAVGRSRPFCAWLFPRLRAAFPGLRPRDPEALYRAVNRVEAGAIRTEADEVAYNLHIILRFELERDLLEKRLPVADLEAAWNDRSERDLGLRPPDAARGVLQDVHWSGGAFGYFPTYTLGNLYAAELFEAARRDLGDLDDAIALGDFGVLLGWLREKVHRRGRLLQASALIADVAGHPPTSAPLVSTLEAKYAELYDLQPNG
jgi:carboxypeptidase Taq